MTTPTHLWTRRRRRTVVTVVVVLVLVVIAAASAIRLRDEPRQQSTAQPSTRQSSPTATADTRTAGPSRRPGTAGPTTSGPHAPRPGPTPDVEAARCPAATVQVETTAQLEQALANARPGMVIRLADGQYDGRFVTQTSGTVEAPIWLCGGTGAVLDAGDTSKGYGVHLDGASHWRLLGFTVRNAQKGVMVDAGSHNTIQDLVVTQIGDEAIHLRRGSSDNIVLNNTVSHTGKRRAKFGEGIYVGTAESNWCDISDCAPDRSDRNILKGNRISATTSENVDIKEGTTGGFLIANELDGADTKAADSNVDVKGNAWRVVANTVRNPPKDAFQTHEILDGWGTRNVFENNAVTAGGGSGFVVALTPARDNEVACSNTPHGDMEVSKTGCR